MSDYEKYRKLFPDAEDPSGMMSAPGSDKTLHVISRAVKEKKRIVFRYTDVGKDGVIDGFEYHLEKPK